MNNIIPVLVIIILSSCCGKHTEVRYKYLDVEIIRIDECGITTFSYRNKESKISGKIWVEYSGINDGFSGYLKFHKKGKVTLLSGDGYFQSEGLDTTLFGFKRISSYERPEISPSVYEILTSTRYEQERNRKFETGIRASYEVDENEWW